MRPLRRDWVELEDEAGDLVWRAIGVTKTALLPYETARALFLQALGVAGRFRHEAIHNSTIRCYLAGGRPAQVWVQCWSPCGSVVALAAAAGPEGPFAEEVLALATTMLVSGLTSEVAP